MRKTATLLIATALIGCGGDGPSSGGTTVIPDGFYSGTTSTGRTATGLVLDNGTFYVIYSAQNKPSLIAGAIQGTGSALNGVFISSNVKDINLEGAGVLSADLTASFTIKQSFDGTISYPSLNQTVKFTSAFNPSYEATPSVPGLSGIYVGRVASTNGSEAVTVTISPIGTVDGISSSGCQILGVVTPRPHGNAYNFSVTFGAFPCLAPGLTVTGAAFSDFGGIVAVAMTPGRDTGFIYTGTKIK